MAGVPNASRYSIESMAVTADGTVIDVVRYGVERGLNMSGHKGKADRGEGAAPRHAGIARDLRDAIAAGSLPVGAVLPTELELCARYGVSRHTVRIAIADLAEAGLVTRRKRFGTVVQAIRPNRSYRQTVASVDDLVQYGADHVRSVRHARLVTASPTLAQDLACPAGTKWFCVSSLRYGRGTGDLPLGLTDVYVDPGSRRGRGARPALAGPVDQQLRRRAHGAAHRKDQAGRHGRARRPAAVLAPCRGRRLTRAAHRPALSGRRRIAVRRVGVRPSRQPVPGLLQPGARWRRLSAIGRPGGDQAWLAARRSSLIMTDAFSAIMIVAALVLPDTMRGMIDASTTRRPDTPFTRRRWSTTARSSGPMRHVLVG